MLTEPKDGGMNQSDKTREGGSPTVCVRKKAMERNREEFTFGSMSTALSLLLLYQQSGSIKLGHVRGEDVKMRQNEQGSS